MPALAGCPVRRCGAVKATPARGLKGAPCVGFPRRVKTQAFFSFPWSKQEPEPSGARPPLRTTIDPIEGNTAVGIDLGTTNSAIAVWRNGKGEVLETSRGKTTLPSVLMYDKDGEVLVGFQAIEQGAVDPKSVIRSSKRLIGLNFIADEVARQQERGSVDIGASKVVEQADGDPQEEPQCVFSVPNRCSPVSPVDVATELLSALVSIARQQLEGKTIDRAVITVPARFGAARRAATQRAAERAGLTVLRIINEPTAAALAYGYGGAAHIKYDGDGVPKPVRLLVYDLGGGTLDVSLMEVDEGLFEVLGSSGNEYLGGDDFDRVIFDIITTRAEALDHSVSNLDDEHRNTLRMAAESLKINLSEKSEAQFDLGRALGMESHTISITRSDFEDACTDLLSQCTEPLADCIEDAKERGYDIDLEALDAVLLVGGATKMPCIQQMLLQHTKQVPRASIDPDQVVAIGASLQAAALSGIVDREDLIVLDENPDSEDVMIWMKKLERMMQAGQRSA
eukprot:scaffold1973_cov399-Prasinococcus_capsulatus_cf.AAC.22